MVNEADALIAFWDGKSKYTKDLIEAGDSRTIEVMPAWRWLLQGRR